jgi:protocatechuate 3,4-dioxygenase beta subunit
MGTLLAGLIGVGGGDHHVLGDEPKGEKPEAVLNDTPNAPTRKKTAHGRVVGPDGKPVSSATVTVSRYRRAATDPYFSGSGSHWKPDRQEMDRARSDADGRFHLTFEDRKIGLAENRDSPDRWDTPLIVAWAPGFGPDSVEGDVTEDHPLRLARDDVPVTGRIIDLEGRPVAGATVRVHRLESPESADAFERWLKAVARQAADDERWFPSGSQLAGSEPAVSTPVTTDADGNFRLNGLGRDRLATLEISGPSIALLRVQVITRLMKHVGGSPVDKAQLLDLDYHGAVCTIAVQPARLIEGLVRDAETKESIPGAIVTAMQLFASNMSIEGMIVTTTDDQGRYRLTGLPKGNGHRLGVYPALDQRYFITEFLEVPASPGSGPVHYDIALKRGIWITGRVIDAKTVQPVQAAIHYYPLLANNHAKGYPNFRDGLSLFWTGGRYRTDVDGHYRVVGLPGRGIVAVKTFDTTYKVGVGVDRLSVQPGTRPDRNFGLPTYNAMNPREFEAVAEVDPPAGAVGASRDILLERGISLTVQVVDPDGKPLTEVTADGRSVIPRMGDPNLHEQTRFQVVGLDPKVTRTVVFEHRIRKLGAMLVIKPGDLANTGERIVTLRPCATVTGRLVDAEGKPVRGGIERHVSYGDNDEGSTAFQPEDLDVGGRFRIDGLAPGAKYTLWAKDPADYSGKGERERVFRPFAIVSNLIPLSGQVLDVGTFNAVSHERIQEPEKSAVIDGDRGKGQARDVPINGRIIDLEGRPVAGATVQIVSYNTSRTGDLTRWLDAVRSAQAAITARQYLNHLETPATARKATTDQQGRFRFESIGAERIAHLLLEGPTIASAFFTVVTRRIESFSAHDPASYAGQGTETIYGADFTFSASPGRPIEGIVRDARTNQTLAGVIVRRSRSLQTVHAVPQMLATATNEHGRFRLVGLSKARTSPRVTRDLLTLIPNDEQPYFMRNIPIPDPPGLERVSMEIELHRGIWITGKVSDKKTGNPIKGVPLHYLPFLENKFAQATPEFGPNRSVLVIVRDRYKTKPDGTYRLVGLPGRAIVGVAPWDRVPFRFGYGADSIEGKDEHGHFATWWNPFPAGETSLLSMKEINPPESAEVVHLDLELDPGASVRVRVVDREGKPLPGSGVIRRMSTSNLETMPDAEFDVLALGPGEKRSLLLRHEGRNLGKAVQMHPGDDKAGPVTVTLEPHATLVGCVVDADGNPVAGATVRGNMLPFGRNDTPLGEVATGKDGRFQIPDVPTGVDYSLTITSRGNVTGRLTVTIQTTVRPGETTDVCEISLKGN